MLIAAAVWFAFRGVQWSAVGSVRVDLLLLIAVLFLLNIGLTAALLWVLTLPWVRHGRLRWGTMVQLIAWSNLLNYVPVIRAGLWGRAAYLKRMHGVLIRESVLTLAITLGLALAVTAVLGVFLMALQPEAWAWAGAATALLVVAWAYPKVIRRGGRVATPPSGPWLAGWSWVGLRTLDALVAGARLWIAFAAIGRPIRFSEAVVLGCGSLLIKLVGLTPNGLGLSEWVVAGLSAALTPVAATHAAAAALLDRLVEVVMSVAAGLVAWWRLRGAERVS